MRYLAIICARSKSKGIKNKNILKINNIPLIGHSIKMAKSIKRISKVIVSTDSDKIAKIARNYGAEVPFLRPKKLSTDKSKEIDSWKHAINFLYKRNENFDAILSIPCTSPLRKKIDIENCIDKFNTKKYDTIITIKKSSRNPFFNMVKKNRRELYSIVNKPKKYIFNRQQAPKVYDVCTICFVSNIKFVMKSKNLFSGRVGGVLIPKSRSLDIDDINDFILAKNIYEKKIRFYK